MYQLFVLWLIDDDEENDLTNVPIAIVHPVVGILVSCCDLGLLYRCHCALRIQLSFFISSETIARIANAVQFIN